MGGRPTVLLVTSGGPREGRGHVSRAVTLAQALTDAGAEVAIQLLRGELTDRQAEALRASGVQVGVEPAAPGAVVVDVPDPDEGAGARPRDRVVVFDDVERFTGDAAIVVQPSLPTWNGRATAGRVLAGWAYAPIRHELRELAARSPEPASDVPEVVVTFGGGDPADVSARLVPAIASALSSRAAVTAIVGPAYAGTLRRGDGWTLVRDPSDLDLRLARATVAVIGGGTMKAEVALLGVPAIMVAVSDDQPPVAPAFAATGASEFVGDGRTIDPEVVAAATRTLLDDPVRRAAMREAGRAAVDGAGADRLADAILDLARAGR